VIYRSIEGPFLTSDLYPERRGDRVHLLLDAELFDPDPAPGGTIDAWALGLIAVRAVGSSADGRAAGAGSRGTFATGLEADGRAAGSATPRATSTGLEVDGRAAGSGQGPVATSTGLAREAVTTTDAWALAMAPRAAADASTSAGGASGSSVASRPLGAGGGGALGPLADALEVVDGRASTSGPGWTWHATINPDASATSGPATGAGVGLLEVEADGWALGWVLGPDAVRDVTGDASGVSVARSADVVADVTGEGVRSSVEGVAVVLEIWGCPTNRP